MADRMSPDDEAELILNSLGWRKPMADNLYKNALRKFLDGEISMDGAAKMVNPYKDCNSTREVLELYRAKILDPAALVSFIVGIEDVFEKQTNFAVIRIGEIWDKTLKETGWQKKPELPKNYFENYQSIEAIVQYLADPRADYHLMVNQSRQKIVSDAHDRIFCIAKEYYGKKT